jgi:putative ABC transport system permease protein
VHGKALEDVKAVMKSDSLLTTGCYFPAAKAIGLNTSLVRAFMILVAAAAMLFSARIQWASALERRRSFAILKAIGWSNRVIVLQQISEALIQSVIGSAVGLVAGLMILILLPVNELLGIDATMTGAVNPVICFSVIAFAIAAGLLAGILPVLLVVRQRPADILRRI